MKKYEIDFHSAECCKDVESFERLLSVEKTETLKFTYSILNEMLRRFDKFPDNPICWECIFFFERAYGLELLERLCEDDAFIEKVKSDISERAQELEKRQ